jgi:PIN domain nuclease of toxin-antitoxin system
MRYLLDSQSLLLALFQPGALSGRGQSALADPSNEILVSSISPYELELKKRLGKLSFPDIADWPILLARNSFASLQLHTVHGVVAARLPMHHRDPWDRLLIAQALTEGLVLIARDRKFADYSVPTIW